MAVSKEEAFRAGRAPTRRRFQIGGSYLVTVFLLVSLNFFLPRLMPGDPISAMLAASSRPGAGGAAALSDPALKASLRRYYGLDRPVGLQYLHYLGGLFTGDLGTSIRYNRPVALLIGERLPWTVLLGGAAILLATAMGVASGVQAGWRRGGRLDRGLLVFFGGVANFPAFFVASLALYVFAVKFHWVPLGGATTPFTDYGPLRRSLDIAHHLVLPALVEALQLAAAQFLVMRAGMVSEMGAGYLLMGRAKGVEERVLKYGYAARNAALPMVSFTALMLSFAVAGTIFVESVFAYPGIGRLTFEAAGFRDYPLMQGAFLLLAFSVVTFNLLADLAMTRLDPRTVG